MKRTIFAALVAILMVGLVASTALAAPSNKYVTFGSATVTENPAGTFTIVSNGPDPVYAPSPEYGGVYINSKANSGKVIGTVAFSFVSSGDVAQQSDWYGPRNNRALVNVTDLGVMIKEGPASGLVWVTSLSTGSISVRVD